MNKNIIYLLLFFSVQAFGQSSEIDDCTNDTIVSIENLPSTRGGAHSIVYNSEIYIFGGAQNGSAINSTSKYSINSDSWSNLANMPTARSHMGVAELNGIVYCMAGYGGFFSNKNEAYNISTNSWQLLPNLPAAMSSCDAVTLNGKIYVIGGSNGITVNHFYAYSPATNTYQTLSTPIQNRSEGSLLVYNNKIYLVGGQYYNGSQYCSNKLDEYDPLLDAWSTKTDLPAALRGSAVTLYNNKIYVFGGSSTTPVVTPQNSLYAYDFTSNTWSTLNNAPFTIYDMDAISNNNIAYLFGGYNSTNVTSNLCYKYYCLDLLASVNELYFENYFSVFPNPTKDIVTIELTIESSILKGHLIIITNSLGQNILTKSVNSNQIKIDSSTLGDSGIYFINLIDSQNNIVKTKKIVRL
jgi:N-acetylneuraminic acid mutarotase